MDLHDGNKLGGFIAVFAFHTFFDDDSEEEDNTGDDKIRNFAEHIVPNFSDHQFKLHFRMEPRSFEAMVRMLHTVADKNITPGRPSLLLEKEAMIMIWSLANIESFRQVANRFGVTKSTCWSALYRTCHLLLKVNRRFQVISWPSHDRANEIMEAIQRRHHLPGVIGAIDGSHTPIKAPREYHTSYINRKGYHSVVLQGVCDHNLLFTDVYVGETGSLHDVTVYKRSDLYHQIRNDEVDFPNNSHLIGDLAYTLSCYLLVGFKNYGNLTNRQKNFNLILSKSRAMIENAFALLKGRFRRLKMMDTVRLDLISLLIVSACILHNICIYSFDDLHDLLDLRAEIEEEQRNNPNNLLDIDCNNERNVNEAQMKRMNIVNSLPIINRQHR